MTVAPPGRWQLRLHGCVGENQGKEEAHTKKRERLQNFFIFFIICQFYCSNAVRREKISHLLPPSFPVRLDETTAVAIYLFYCIIWRVRFEGKLTLVLAFVALAPSWGGPFEGGVPALKGSLSALHRTMRPVSTAVHWRSLHGSVCWSFLFQ